MHGKVEGGLKITESISCSGSEDRVEECRLRQEQGARGGCRMEEQIVSVACVPDSWAGCEVWHGGSTNT